MTIETFCKAVWNLSYTNVQKGIEKNDYCQFCIPKKNGTRTITYLPIEAPLYILQKNLKKFYLDQKFEFPTCSKGFLKKESYIAYLEPHISSNYFFRLDIKDFFHSVTSTNLKNELGNWISAENEKEEILDLIVDIVTYSEVLPQGTVTSPIMSNIFMIRVDQRILKYCQTLNIKYTRYADDMLFSSNSFNFKEKKWFLRKIKHILASKGLSVNYSKLKYQDKEISLNGYVISSTGIRLSRERLSDIRCILAFSKANYLAAKNSPETFLHNVNALSLKHRDLSIYPFDSIFQFVQYLCGYRAFLISFLRYDIDPIFSKRIQKIINNLEQQILKYN